MLPLKPLTMLRLVIFCALFFQHSQLLAQQPSSAYDLIARMHDVSKQLSYEGVFTYQMAGEQRAIKVSHQVVDAMVYERITYMDGPHKDRIRKYSRLSCQPQNFLLPQAQDYYKFNILGESRVAGREVYRVQALPKDAMRLGYLYAIDQQTGLLLQSIIIDQSGRPVERFKYVEIRMNTVGNQPSTTVAQDTAATCVDSLRTGGERLWQWSPTWLPQGFVQVSRKLGDNGRESIAYTDGVTLFTVLIDPVLDEPQYPAVAARLGPTQLVVVNQQIDNSYYRIAVSGQLPRAIANQIAASVKATLAEDEHIDNEAIH